MAETGSMTTDTLHPGVINIDGVHNVRHMGHCRAAGGQTFCSDILRSASLGGLTDEGCAALFAHGMRTVVDLRSARELATKPTRDLACHGITTVHAPVVQYDGSPLNMANFRGHAARYRELLDLGRDAYRILFETIALSEGGVLFHCSAGKDRTGVAAALLLKSIGVSDEEVVADYACSYDLLAQVREEWRPRFDEEGITPEDASRLMASDAADMAETLDCIVERWGSAEGYLLDIGVAPATVTRLKARLAV